jgi:hypothetical protein
MQTQAEVSFLERKLEFLQNICREREEARMSALQALARKAEQQRAENETLRGLAAELQAAVLQRSDIVKQQAQSIAALTAAEDATRNALGSPADGTQRGRRTSTAAAASPPKAVVERMNEIVAHRRLVDLARVQAKELEALRAKAEALRRKSFASFVPTRVVRRFSPDVIVPEKYRAQSALPSVRRPASPGGLALAGSAVEARRASAGASAATGAPARTDPRSRTAAIRSTASRAPAAATDATLEAATAAAQRALSAPRAAAAAAPKPAAASRKAVNPLERVVATSTAPLVKDRRRPLDVRL